MNVYSTCEFALDDLAGDDIPTSIRYTLVVYQSLDYKDFEISVDITRNSEIFCSLQDPIEDGKVMMQ